MPLEALNLGLRATNFCQTQIYLISQIAGKNMTEKAYESKQQQTPKPRHQAQWQCIFQLIYFSASTSCCSCLFPYLTVFLGQQFYRVMRDQARCCGWRRRQSCWSSQSCWTSNFRGCCFFLTKQRYKVLKGQIKLVR